MFYEACGFAWYSYPRRVPAEAPGEAWPEGLDQIFAVCFLSLQRKAQKGWLQTLLLRADWQGDWAPPSELNLCFRCQGQKLPVLHQHTPWGQVAQWHDMLKPPCNTSPSKDVLVTEASTSGRCEGRRDVDLSFINIAVNMTRQDNAVTRLSLRLPALDSGRVNRKLPAVRSSFLGNLGSLC